MHSEEKINLTPIVIFALLLFALVIRIPALFIPHIENDEVIYQVLADKVSKNPFDYTLRNSPILQNLPKMNYDQPLFHRPPLFVYSLAIFKNLLGKHWGVLLSVLSAMLTMLVLFGIARELYNEKIAFLSAIVLSFCPLLLFCSTRILIDTLLTLLVTTTVWVFLKAIKKKSRPLFALAGLVMGLAILTKEPGVLVVLPCCFLLFREGIDKEKGACLFFFLGCAILTISPWYGWFFSVYKTFIPWWARIFPENIEMFPFIKMAVARPWYFYFQNITLAMPIYIFGWINILVCLRKKRLGLELIWAFSFLFPLTLYGVMGQGYQTRYILPAIPALAILSADFAANKKGWVWVMGIFLLGIGFLTGILNAFFFLPADIFPLYKLFSLR